MSSHFAEALEILLQRRRLVAAKVAAEAGISPSQLSKWIRGQQTSITRDDFTKLALAVSPDEFEHAELVAAHLEDERFGPGSQLVRIAILRDNGPLRLHDARVVRSQLAQAEAHLSRLAREPNNDMRDLLIDLARVTGCQI